MGKISTKENKFPYHLRREELGLSRDEASEMLEWISPERLERIENEKSDPQPEEIIAMADAYKDPSLCNYYCANQCPIGKQYVPEVKIRDLSQIVLETIASLNHIKSEQDRLIEIAADGRIDESEIKDFVHIQKDLERISITVEALQLWAESMLANGSIDMEAYQKYKDQE